MFSSVGCLFLFVLMSLLHRLNKSIEQFNMISSYNLPVLKMLLYFNSVQKIYILLHNLHGPQEEFSVMQTHGGPGSGEGGVGEG